MPKRSACGATDVSILARPESGEPDVVSTA
jgi:hypothetical protein